MEDGGYFKGGEAYRGKLLTKNPQAEFYLISDLFSRLQEQKKHPISHEKLCYCNEDFHVDFSNRHLPRQRLPSFELIHKII